MPLNTKLILDLAAAATKALDLGVVTLPLAYRKVLDLSNGTGANAADQLFSDTRTLAPSGTEDLDLAGVLLDSFGVALTFARIKLVLISAAAGNTNNVNVSRPASNGLPIFLAASDAVPVLPSGTFLWAAPGATGIPVVAGTGDLLTITNSAAGTSVTYDVVIIGASA